MGLLIKQNGDKKITIEGTSIELPEIYLRIAFNAKVDGKTCEVALYPFASEAMFLEGKTLFTNVPTANLYVVVDKGETQSIDAVLSHLKTYYETELGYIVEISK
jgi:hypothetical protein